MPIICLFHAKTVSKTCLHLREDNVENRLFVLVLSKHDVFPIACFCLWLVEMSSKNGLKWGYINCGLATIYLWDINKKSLDDIRCLARLLWQTNHSLRGYVYIIRKWHDHCKGLEAQYLKHSSDILCHVYDFNSTRFLWCESTQIITTWQGGTITIQICEPHLWESNPQAIDVNND